MTDLLQDEILALEMIAGRKPMRVSAKIWICIEELRARGLCSVNDPPTLTLQGLRSLETATGTAGFNSHVICSVDVARHCADQ